MRRVPPGAAVLDPSLSRRRAPKLAASETNEVESKSCLTPRLDWTASGHGSGRLVKWRKRWMSDWADRSWRAAVYSQAVSVPHPAAYAMDASLGTFAELCTRAVVPACSLAKRTKSLP